MESRHKCKGLTKGPNYISVKGWAEEAEIVLGVPDLKAFFLLLPSINLELFEWPDGQFPICVRFLFDSDFTQPFACPRGVFAGTCRLNLLDSLKLSSAPAALL
jgi:hypothetical protein